MPDIIRSPRTATTKPAAARTALVHWPIVALAAVPCLLFVGIVIGLLAMMPAPRTVRPAPALAAIDPVTLVEPVPVADDFNAEIIIPAHHAMAAVQDLPIFDLPELPVQHPIAARDDVLKNDVVKNDVARIDAPRNDIVPVKPEKEEKDGCFGTAVNFLPSPAEAFNAAKKEKRLTLILHVSGNFEDSGFT